MADTYKTIPVTPLDLKVGDKVYEHGAVVEVMLVNRYDSQGSIVQSNICKLIGSDMGGIPCGYWTGKESYIASGFTQAHALEQGELYWNVQGNNRARCFLIVE